MDTILEIKKKNFYLRMFILPIYSSKICFVRFNDDKGYDQVIKFLRGVGVNCDSYEEDDYRNAYGFVVKEKTKYGNVQFMFMNGCEEYKSEYVNTLSHESYHLVQNICSYHGLEFYPTGDNEHIAYLTGAIYSELNKM